MKKNPVKLVALALFGAFITFCALTTAPVVQITQASSANLVGTFTSAPSESTCAITGCHGGALTTNSELLKIEPTRNADPDHPDDRSFTIKVTLMNHLEGEPEDASRKRWGFQMTAIKDDGHGIGTFIPDAEHLTKVPQQDGPTGDRPYIEHNIQRDEAGNVTADGTFAGHMEGAQWIFKWQPPDGYSGPVTFYAAGCAANGNNRSNGDRVYTKNRTISTGPPVPPEITEIKLKASKILIFGSNFDEGAVVLLNDIQVRTIHNDEAPTTMLVAKKIGKALQPGMQNTLKVRNGNDPQLESEPFPFDAP